MSNPKLLAQDIASQLSEAESNVVEQIVRAVEVSGVELVQSILKETIDIESGGGMMLPDNSRRRTAGGVFFYLLRKRVSKAQWFIIRPEIAPTTEEVPPLDWALRAEAVQEARQEVGSADTARITVRGKAKETKRKDQIMIITIEGGHQLLPMSKQLPRVASLVTTYKVCVTSKQWRKVESSLRKNPNDEVIATGYAVPNEKTGSILVLATDVVTKSFLDMAREFRKGDAL